MTSIPVFLDVRLSVFEASSPLLSSWMEQTVSTTVKRPKEQGGGVGGSVI